MSDAGAMNEQGMARRMIGAGAPWVAAAFVVLCLATIPAGVPIPLAAMTALGALGAASVLLARADPQGRWQRVTWWPVAAILGAMAVSVLNCRLPGLATERSTSAGVFALIAVAAQVAAWDRRALRMILIACAGLVVVVAADVGWQRITGASLLRAVPGAGARLAGSHGNTNDLAVASLMLPLGLAALPTGWWLIGVPLAIVGGVPAWLSASRQAALAWVVGLSVVAGARLGRRRAVIAVLAVVVAVAATVALTPALRSRAVQTWREGAGIREQLTVYGMELFVEHPVTGIGPGLFGQYYQLDAREGWSWRGTPLPKVGMPWVHSLPVEVLCELGLIGAVAYAATLAIVLRRLWRARSMPELEGRVAVAVLAVLAAGALAGLVDLTFIKDWVRCGFWLAVGLGLAVGRSVSRERPSSPA
ncbi:MAG: O-antigen ligase family protein [Planctomycetes bacterium]|nr:O-antigen ligase family protein [Planctomycetota bacterium]